MSRFILKQKKTEKKTHHMESKSTVFLTDAILFGMSKHPHSKPDYNPTRPHTSSRPALSNTSAPRTATRRTYASSERRIHRPISDQVDSLAA